MHVPKTMTDEEVTEILGDMGLVAVKGDRHTWWRRLRCRVFGPHAWVLLQRLDPSRGALIEEGVICDVCHREVPG